MQTTTNFQLPKWEKTDRIMMSDFNDMTEKLDTALTARNCQLYTAAYVGDGEKTRTWTFPAKPMLVMMVCSNGLTVMIRGASKGCTYVGSSHYQFPAGTWTEDSVTATYSSSSAIANGPNDAYGLFAILEAE